MWEHEIEPLLSDGTSLPEFSPQTIYDKSWWVAVMSQTSVSTLLRHFLIMDFISLTEIGSVWKNITFPINTESFHFDNKVILEKQK